MLAPSARLEREEISKITHEALEELPEIFRSVIVMREFEECTYQEIADLLEISIGTVESRLYRARGACCTDSARCAYRAVLRPAHPAVRARVRAHGNGERQAITI